MRSARKQMLGGDRTINPPSHQFPAYRVRRDRFQTLPLQGFSPGAGSRDLETIDAETPLQVSTPSPTSRELFPILLPDTLRCSALLCCASLVMGHSRLCTLHFWVGLTVVPAMSYFSVRTVLHAATELCTLFANSVSTSEISNSPEDDATQIPMSRDEWWSSLQRV
uniref:Uncharacterized protein n=1 Tax=Sphaerodactylus townsendi TaxID=933632 RepID=A0ACB8FDE1_9SAUR